MNWWIAQSEFTGDAMGMISSWAMGEKSPLISSNVSNLRNGKSVRPSLRLIEALGALNVVCWRWHTQGQQACLERYGPYSSWGIDPVWLERAVWLEHPSNPEAEPEPLVFADFCEIFAGLLTLPNVGVALSPSEAPDLNAKLAALFDEILRDSGTYREGLERIRAAYPVQGKERWEGLRDVIIGTRNYSREEMQVEMMALATCIGTIRGEADYSPARLHAELSNGRRRT
jgi:hypothetical protein